ncbi:MAG: hypothetical protein AB1489_43305, partial [Acidobacteriota bacterium]
MSSIYDLQFTRLNTTANTDSTDTNGFITEETPQPSPFQTDQANSANSQTQATTNNQTVAIRDGIINNYQKFALQQKLTKEIIQLPQKVETREEINIDVLIPQGRTEITDTEWKQGAARGYYQCKGLTFSQAAIEEAAATLWVVEKGKPDYVRDKDGNIKLDSNNQPIPAYHISFTPKSGTIQENFKANEAKDARENLDQFIPEAERITQIGTPAIAGTTVEERWQRVKQIYQENYGDQTTQEAIDEIFSLGNLTLLGAMEVGMKTAAAPVLVAGMAAKMTIVDAPRWYSEGVDIKKLVYGAEKPSDLEKAAEKLAELSKEVKVIAGTAIIGGVVNGIEKGITRLPEIKVPNITPTGEAVVTQGGPPLNWKMPIETQLGPGLPIGDFVKDVGISAGKGMYGGTVGMGREILEPLEARGNRSLSSSKKGNTPAAQGDEVLKTDLDSFIKEV